jgi:hypothetical protein
MELRRRHGKVFGKEVVGLHQESASPDKLTLPEVQTSPLQTSACSSPGEIDRMVMQVDSATAYTVQELQICEAINNSTRAEPAKRDPGVDKWLVHTDPLSEKNNRPIPGKQGEGFSLPATASLRRRRPFRLGH